MRRKITTLAVITLFIFAGTLTTWAQDDPAATEEVPPAENESENFIDSLSNFADDIDAATDPNQQSEGELDAVTEPEQETEPPPPAPVEETAPEPTAVPPANIPFGDELPILIAARGDLELLANAALGNSRPLGWNGSLEVTNPQLPLLIRLDLELLAGTALGETRPDDWFGAVASTPFAIARDIRHDLEALADIAVNPGIRPPGWAGDDPLFRCSRATQNLVTLLETSGSFVLNVDPSSADYCQQVERQASLFVERTVLAGETAVTSDDPTTVQPNFAAGSITVNGTQALSFYDRFATERAGRIPPGTTVQPLGRSYTQFSRMLLVRGVGFEVFVDYTQTTLDPEAWESLPDINDLSVAATCNADWCE